MKAAAKNYKFHLLVAIAGLVLFFGNAVLAQDGSDMTYVKPEQLDRSYVGRRMHVDFYRRSFGKLGGKGLNVDKVSLVIGGKTIEFIEHRVDDGFNNWFSGQYLESIDKKIRIKEFKLLNVDEQTITVTGYFNIDPFEKEFVFKKSDIAQLLLKKADK